MMKLWNTKTWKLQGNPIECNSEVYCVRYSPSGEFLAVATSSAVQIYDPGTRKRVASFKAHTLWNLSLAWTPDGTRLLIGGKYTICEWDTTTWQQVGDPWTGYATDVYYDIAVDPAGEFVACASFHNHVRLWRLSDRRTIAFFGHSSSSSLCVTFSVDGKHILSGGKDKIISEWAVPKSKARYCP
jgi:WD40 repeat protein